MSNHRPEQDQCSLRLVRLEDSAELAAAYRRNLEHLQPWEPQRAETFYTEAGQREAISSKLEELAGASTLPWVLTEAERIIGTVTVTGIVRGPFMSGNLGYWIDRNVQGRGQMSTVVAQVCRIVAEEYGLHRLQAGTLLHNQASQRVLRRNGFEAIGVARNYLKIDGRWQDHLLFQRIFGS
ncbi:ribosomal-protein-alanine N-acetyltransferase [Psychromicrobium silvestre]|uniref:Ribosomal-protein-alanine N-acetyltransferase n=1 Tax=Psychromicrobium silvestre TaxID=1645614 RepID=A0A7Y9LS68_9MICC|nr:GNAT family N-acetyltransferase [Psychromicrobium silvestre]NYE94619.1 ribosomal-protein-alanine N-acetyltransferase [Psychromicrobium silvestre]